MNLRKFLLSFALVMVVALSLNANSAMAVSKFSKAKNTIVSAVEEAKSGDKKVTKKEVVSKKAEKTSGEEATKTVDSGDKKAAEVSGEKEVAKEAKASGEKEAAKEVKTSGEKEAAKEVKTSGEKEAAKEVKASGEKEPAKEDKKAEKTTSKVIKDLAKKAWYVDYVTEAVDEELMTVQEDNKFNPEVSLTKQEVADALYKLAQRNEEDVKKSNSKKEEKEEVDTLQWAIKKSVMRTADNAEDVVSREQVARYVYSYARNVEGHKKLTTREKQDNEVKYGDKNNISPLASEAVLWCNMNKIMIGRPDDVFAAKDDTTRAEAATVFVRLNDFLAK